MDRIQSCLGGSSSTNTNPTPTDPNYATCGTAISILNACESLIPTSATLSEQAHCLCYDSNGTFDPDPSDDSIVACESYYETANPTLLPTVSSLLGICTNMAASAASTGVLSAASSSDSLGAAASTGFLSAAQSTPVTSAAVSSIVVGAGPSPSGQSSKEEQTTPTSAQISLQASRSTPSRVASPASTLSSTKNSSRRLSISIVEVRHLEAKALRPDAPAICTITVAGIPVTIAGMREAGG
jgi:hypothetical protein